MALPKLLADLKDHWGEEAIFSLLNSFGGKSISIPRHPTDSVIEVALGSDLACWLCERYGGEVLDVPGSRSIIAQFRRNHISANPKKSANDLATEIGVTSRTIRKIRSELRTTALEKG